MSNTGLRGNVFEIPKIDNTLTKEGYGADAKAVGEKFIGTDNEIKNLKAKDEELNNKHEASNTVETVSLWVEPNVESTKNVCYKCGKVCMVVFDFTTKQEISASGVPIFADLPKPKSDYTFEVHSMGDNAPYWLGVYSSGHLSTAYVKNIPSGTRLFGTFTYITE